MNTSVLSISDEISCALEEGIPVVALETTIVSHGMPYPTNIETALEVESIIRKNGAIPATIAIMHGKIRVGITEDELEFMGTSTKIVKASRRDLPAIFSRKLNAATTVASTMICASMAGIPIFATGGIGGVHRGAQQTFDISADLQELARTNVAVIAAGAKAILDLPLTLEYLETAGVPVLGFKTSELPAFYTRESGLPVDYQVDSYEDAANLLHAKWDNGLSGGVLITNPIPAEAAMDKKVIDRAIEQALREAATKEIAGKKLTPFLLKTITDLTEGKSLSSNIALIKHNAEVAAGIAKAYSRG